MADAGWRMEGYKKLEVYRLAHDLAVRIHAMSLTLPAVERYEEAPQIRRSSKRVAASIVEGHALRKYKSLYLNFLYRGIASCDETMEHLDLLHETKSLSSEAVYRQFAGDIGTLARKLTRFIQAVEQQHRTSPPHEELEPPPDDDPDADAARELARLRRNPASGIRHPASDMKERKNGR